MVVSQILKGMKGQWPLAVEELSGQGVELFGRGAAFGSLLDHQLPFLDHVHEFNTRVYHDL